MFRKMAKDEEDPEGNRGSDMNESDDNSKGGEGQETAPSSRGIDLSVFDFNASELPVVIYFTAAFLFFWVVLADRDILGTGNFAYGLCVGAFGMIFAVVLLVLMRKNPEKLQAFGVYFNALLSLWATIPWGIFTFGPYIYAGNGFFSLWVMMFAGLWISSGTPGQYANAFETPMANIYGLVMCAVVIIIATTTVPGVGFNQVTTAYPVCWLALIASILAILLGVGLYVGDRFNSTGNDLIPALIMMWVLVGFFFLTLLNAFLMTLIGPFELFGNGYLAVWMSVIFSAMGIRAAKKQVE